MSNERQSQRSPSRRRIRRPPATAARRAPAPAATCRRLDAASPQRRGDSRARDQLLDRSACTRATARGRSKSPCCAASTSRSASGEFLAIVGQSGSGKSTLLHLLGTLDAPDAGEIHFDGHRIDNLPAAGRDALRNRHFGMIFQFYHLLPELTHAGKRAGAADDRARRAGATCGIAGEHRAAGRANCWRWSAWATA